ncbi:MAG: inositol phosphorylceramide synthase [Actinobacteria bacterium]|nr:MAG: inositol phosphorylceramide synthase [Actinomycetota bacterium]
MLARARSLQARALPHGWPDVIRQLALFAAAYYGYRVVRGAVYGRAGTAFENARNLIDAERALHVFVEPTVQAWASGSHLVVDVASWIYINCQTTITLSALIWLYLFRNESFYFVRNMMVVGMVLALIGYIVLPTAPPRFFPEWGFVDSVAQFTGVRSDSVAIDALFNPYAAVPSMHVAFALMIGWPLARLVRWNVLRVFWGAYPFLVTFVIVITANHFLADAFLGACTAGLAAYTASWLARARPAAWAFAPA